MGSWDMLIHNSYIFIIYLYFNKSTTIEMKILVKIQINHIWIYTGAGMGIVGYLVSQYYLPDIETKT